jgi:hypothetical protein
MSCDKDQRAGRAARSLRRLLLATAAGAAMIVPGTTLGLETLVASIAKLRYDNSVKRDNGTLKIRALVDDNSTVGLLQAGLLAGTVSLSVSDGGLFGADVAITGCKLRPSERISCRSLDRTVRAQFLPTAQGPFIYNMRVSARRLPDALTGNVTPVGPVSLELHQPGVVRTDVISDCGARGSFKLVCREP